MCDSFLCKKCKRLLVVGTIRGVDEEWCPNCKNFQIFSKKDAEIHFSEQYAQKMKAIRSCWSKYSKDSLIGSLIAFREGDIHFQKRLGRHSFDLFISISYIIKKIVDEDITSFGLDEIKVMDVDFQKIVRYAEHLLLDLKFIQHIKNDICLLVKIPKEHLREYTVEYDKNIKYEFATVDSAHEVQIKFTKKWKHTKENFSKFGLHSLIGATDSKDEPCDVISDVKKSIGLKMAFDMVCHDDSFIDFPDFDNKDKYIELLNVLSHTALGNIDFECDIAKNTFMCTLRPYDSLDFMISNFKNDGKLKELFDLIVFDQSNCNKFPLIFLSHLTQGLFIPPYTCYLVHSYLKAKYVTDHDLENAIEGGLFELETAKKLNTLGISTRVPNKCSEVLINIKDDPVEPSLEIDVVGHTKDTIWVIDCKHFFLERSFLTGDRGIKLQRKLKGLKIEQKQDARIRYVKDNLAKWGFSKRKIKHFKSVVVTLLKEPLNKIGYTHIVCESELENLYLLSDYKLEKD